MVDKNKNEKNNSITMEIKGNSVEEATEAVVKMIFSNEIKEKYLGGIKDEKKRKIAKESIPKRIKRFKKRLEKYISKNIAERNQNNIDFNVGGFIKYLSEIPSKSIGEALKKEILKYFREKNIAVSIKLENINPKTKNMGNPNMPNSTSSSKGEAVPYGEIDDNEESKKKFNDEWEKIAKEKLRKSKEGRTVFEYDDGYGLIDEGKENEGPYDKGFGMIDNNDPQAVKEFDEEFKNRGKEKSKEESVVFEYGEGRGKIEEKEAKEFEIEVLKNKMEEAHRGLIKAQTEFNRAQNEYGGFVKRMKNIFSGISFNKDKRDAKKEERIAVKVEFEEAKEHLEASKARFAKFFEEYASALYKKYEEEGSAVEGEKSGGADGVREKTEEELYLDSSIEIKKDRNEREEKEKERERELRIKQIRERIEKIEKATGEGLLFDQFSMEKGFNRNKPQEWAEDQMTKLVKELKELENEKAEKKAVKENNSKTGIVEQTDDEKNKAEKNELPAKMSFGAFLAGKKIFDQIKKGKDENGAEKEMTEKISLINAYNAKLLELEKLKMESAEGVKKNFLKRAFARFNSYPRATRIAIATAVVGGAGFLTGGLASGLFFGSYAAGKGIGLAFVNVGMTNVATKNREKFAQKKRKKLYEKIEKQHQNKEGGIFLAINEYNEALRKKQRNDSLKIAGIGLGLGLTAGLFGDEIFSLVKGVPLDNIPFPENPFMEGDMPKPLDGEMPFGVPDNSDTGAESILNQGASEVSSGTEGAGVSGSGSENIPTDIPPTPEGTGEGMKSLGALGEDGTVWEVLKESKEFGGSDRNVAEALLDYKKEMSDTLMGKGMDGVEAQEYVEWRFKHMDAKDVVMLNDDGQIHIEGFDDPKYIDMFENRQIDVSGENEVTLDKGKVDLEGEDITKPYSLVPEHIDGLE